MLAFPSARPPRRHRPVLLALAAAGALGAACSAARPGARGAVEGASDVAALVARLDAAVPRELAELRVPGASVAVIEDGRVALARGYGHADLARRIPVTPRTGFMVGSISKAVTAWGVMRLVEAGQLALDAPVGPSLTRWSLPPSRFPHDGVTPRRLLSHTAGLSVSGYRGWDHRDSVPTLEQSLSGRTNGAGDVRVVAAPGSGWAYSGGGYTLLQLLIEERAGEPFVPYMRHAVLGPLGMTRSTFAADGAPPRGAARPHDDLGEEMAGPFFREQAAAGLYTTLEDLPRFARALLPPAAGGRGGAASVLPPAAVDAMLAPAPGTDGRWALGHAFMAFPDGRVRVGHAGGNRGWQAAVWVGRESRDGIVVLTNASAGWNVVNQVLAHWMEWKTGQARPIRRSVAASILNALHAGGGAAAAAHYRALKARDADRYLFDERELNGLGYALLHAGRVRDAVTLFELNAAEYPEAWNPHDSLGDAYLAAADTARAVASYRRSLARNASNENARRMLERLAPRP